MFWDTVIFVWPSFPTKIYFFGPNITSGEFWAMSSLDSCTNLINNRVLQCAVTVNRNAINSFSLWRSRSYRFLRWDHFDILTGNYTFETFWHAPFWSEASPKDDMRHQVPPKFANHKNWNKLIFKITNSPAKMTISFDFQSWNHQYVHMKYWNQFVTQFCRPKQIFKPNPLRSQTFCLPFLDKFCFGPM